MIPYRSVHFIGVLTPQMASLALYAVGQNCKVTGSDDHRDLLYTPALTSAGVTFFDMFAQVNVNKTTELVVLSRYYDMRHFEAEAALRTNIPVMSEIEFTRLISENVRRFVLLGDYSARFIATLLDHTWKQGHIPLRTLTQTVPIDGGEVLAAYREIADWFVLPASGFKRDAVTFEADFLSFDAEVVIIPGIIYDYPELNTTLDDVYQSYYTFVKRVPRKGLIIGNGDYSRMKRLRSHLADRHIETYGYDRDSDWQIREVASGLGTTTFQLIHARESYGPFTIPYMGSLYVYAAAAVTVASLLMDLPPAVIGRGLASLPKLRRYFEIKTDKVGRMMIDDQADHPEVIQSTLQTIRNHYPDKKIWCLYQPGSYLRTRGLYSELQQALSVANFIYLADIKGYPKEKSEGLNIRNLVTAMKNSHSQTYYFDDSMDMSGLLSDRVASTDCIVTLGVEGICQSVVAPLLTTEEKG